MSNSPSVVALDVIVDRHTAKEALRGMLHAILFHRLYGPVKPQAFEVLDITMPGVVDPEMESLVDEKVDAFWKAAEGVYGRPTSKQGQILVVFSEKRTRKWFQMYDEEVPWEQWSINIEIRQPKTERERQEFKNSLSSMLSAALHQTLTYTASERARSVVPTIKTNEGISPFPVKITVKLGGVEIA